MAANPSARVAIRPAGVSSPQQLDAQAKSALLKLGAFTIALVVLPLSTYFLSLEHYWGPKNTTPAAISAAVMVNVVLVAYIIVAFLEDQPPAPPKAKAQ